MTSNVLEKAEILLTEVNKEELCKKLCLNIFEGLMEGYEDLKQKNPEQTTQFDSKIIELKTEIARQQRLI